MIDNTHILGSPAEMRLTSTRPDLSKTEIVGEGLEVASAGKPAVLTIKFVDEFANVATPGADHKVGISLVPEPPLEPLGAKDGGKGARTGVVSAKMATPHEELEEHSYEGVWVAEGHLEVRYVATTAGFNALYVWCEVPARGDAEKASEKAATGERTRTLLPGSPFSLAVSSGKGNIANSEVRSARRTGRAPLDPCAPSRPPFTPTLRTCSSRTRPSHPSRRVHAGDRVPPRVGIRRQARR